MKPEQFTIPQPIQEIMTKLETQKYDDHPAHTLPLSHDMIEEGKLLDTITSGVDQWRLGIAAKIQSVLVGIKRGPVWKQHESIVEEVSDDGTTHRYYQGISHEPIGMNHIGGYSLASFRCRSESALK